MESAVVSPSFLTRSYISRKVKGGTVIAEDVFDLETHRRMLRHPDDYRRYVGPCRCCGEVRVHTHCIRTRKLTPGQSGSGTPFHVQIRLYRCVSPACRAVFTVLPAFIARRLWRTWETVDAVVNGTESAPARTRRRWIQRLNGSSWDLFQTFTATVRGRVTDVLCEKRPHTRLRLAEVVEEVVGDLADA